MRNVLPGYVFFEVEPGVTVVFEVQVEQVNVPLVELQRFIRCHRGYATEQRCSNKRCCTEHCGSARPQCASHVMPFQRQLEHHRNS